MRVQFARIAVADAPSIISRIMQMDILVNAMKSICDEDNMSAL